VDVFKRALEVAGPDRVMFGTDSSFFPRGWNRAVYDAQVSALDAAGVDEKVRHQIFTDNFDRLFPT
jgi:predicted TIM-barrel fold metal-dependent hydrolase